MKKRIFSHLSLFLSVLFVAVSVLTALPTATQAATPPVTWKNGSLVRTLSGTAGASTADLATVGKTSGKWYWEVEVTDESQSSTASYAMIGVATAGLKKSIAYYGANGSIYKNFASSPIEIQNYSKIPLAKGTTLSIAIDIDNRTIIWYKNGEQISQELYNYTTSDLDSPLYPEIINAAGAGSRTLTANFGATPFKYADKIPAGYLAYDQSKTIVVGESTLKATAGDAKVDLTWSSATNATSYNVKRAITTGGPYTNVATNVTGNTYYTDTTAVNGTPYFYVVTGVNGTTEGAVSNEVTATPIAAVKPNEQATLDVTIDKEKVKVGEGFIADLSLKKATNIYAEDFVVNYDATLMEYLGATEVPGYKVYNETNDKKGTLRFIVASQGKNYGISADTVFLKLKFKAIAVGTGKVDSLSGRIADTTNEYDIAPVNALEDTILIEKPAFLDVNRSGSYTLLDLSIDAFYFGQNAADTDKTLHDADQTEDDQVGDDDLVYIVGQMLINPDYTPNK